MLEDNDKEFVAYSRKLLRELKRLRYLLECNDGEALSLLNELITDTEGDIAG